ncbi:MAG: GIY-YIG nuclease family protein [Deltaproteobacteria bacterium]|nr:GIY-YIG nuclease family protein [Deltaproteobacteria bacterium]
MYYYVYLIKSQKVKNWKYIGSTNDLEKRIEEHNDGKVFSTKNYRPFVLVYYEAYISEKDAREREKQLKYFGNAYKFLMKRTINCLSL